MYIYYTNRYKCKYIQSYLIIFTESEIVGLTSQFATQNCLGCNSKLNLSSKFHAEVATHLPHLKLRTLRTLTMIL